METQNEYRKIYIKEAVDETRALVRKHRAFTSSEVLAEIAFDCFHDALAGDASIDTLFHKHFPQLAVWR